MNEALYPNLRAKWMAGIIFLITNNNHKSWFSIKIGVVLLCEKKSRTYSFR